MTQTDDTAARTGPILRALGLLLLLGGWLSVLHVYHWHFTAPVFFLWLGWAALLATARSLYRAAMTAAEDTGASDDDFWKPVGQREELSLEKRSLLKAIKEIEFDREMGKMSEVDAAELTRLYRQRAIEIIKALEADDAGAEALSVKEQIEREVKARLAVASAGARASAKVGQKSKETAREPAEQKATETVKETAGQKAKETADRKADQKIKEPAAGNTGRKKAGRNKTGQKKAGRNEAGQDAVASRQPAQATGAPEAGEQAGSEAAAAEDRS